MPRKCERPDDERFAAWPLLLETHSKLVEILDAELKARVAGLPLTWYDVLVQLSMSPEGRMPMQRLADSVLLSKSGVTRLVDRMERVDLVERASCDADRRVVYARLTVKGKSLLRKARPIHVAGVEEHFSAHLTDTEARAIRNAFTKILDAASSDKRRTERAG